MRISDWSSDVCSSDLGHKFPLRSDPCFDFPLADWSEDSGVIDMALLSVIRRWHFRQQVPIREIERRTGLSRNTIRKYLRADTVEPPFNVPERPSQADPYSANLLAWRQSRAGQSHT